MNDDLTSNLPAEEDFKLPVAVEHAIAMAPALVEAVQEDPELLAKLSRGQLAVVQDRMVRRVLGNPDSTIAQLAQVHSALSTNAQLKPAAGTMVGGGNQVIINFIRAPGKETVVVEGQATHVAPG